MDKKADDATFTPFRKRATYWGADSARAGAHNVPTVIPPGIPPPLLRALLLRAQVEECALALDSGRTDAALFRENSIDTTNWGKFGDAAEARSREAAAAEMRATVRQIDALLTC